MDAQPIGPLQKVRVVILSRGHSAPQPCHLFTFTQSGGRATSPLFLRLHHAVAKSFRGVRFSLPLSLSPSLPLCFSFNPSPPSYFPFSSQFPRESKILTTNDLAIPLFNLGFFGYCSLRFQYPFVYSIATFFVTATILPATDWNELLRF